jgi:signal transduction histidine kinase
MFRNKEFRLFAVVCCVIAVIATAAGFLVNPVSGILVAVLSAVFWTAFFIFTRERYKDIAKTSRRIDLVLHNDERMEFNDFVEGELSILHNEINKTILRIREQNDALKKDKEYLADSLADIAHQIRTPLTSANLALSLSAKTEDEQERREFIREAEKLIVQTDWLITALLKLSRLDAGVVEFKNERIHVKELIKSAVSPLLIPIELQNIELSVNLPESAVIQCDLNWLSEAVRNILKNCVESAGERGKIEIACNDTPLYTEIIIRDDGPGFGKQDLSRLFDRFYRGGTQNASGYGIGLALSKTIISMQGGAVTAKNRPQTGAEFTIRFYSIL